MSDNLFLDVSVDGIIAGHVDRTSRVKLIATATEDEFNTLEPLLTTVACALVPDHQFEFESSFIKPQAKGSFQQLVRLLKSKQDCPISIFGHADPVGNDAFNKKLSGRRAMAVAAVLTRDIDLWEKKLFKNKHGNDDWGLRSIQLMLDHLGFSLGDISGLMNEETKEAVDVFQTQQGLDVDGDPGPITRARLFELYMDDLCHDKSGKPYRIGLDRFIAQGADDQGKGNYQGCGEANPVLIFSEQEQDFYKQDENRDARNEANAPNRRVIVYLFREGTRVDPNAWPCPRALDKDSGCKKRFWSNGNERRSRRETEDQRNFQDTHDTFACRFYHGLARFSPCEAGQKLWSLKLQVDGPNGDKLALANRNFVLVAGDTATAPTYRGITDEMGILRAPVFSESVTLTLKLDVSGYLFDEPERNEEDDQEDETPAGEEWEGEDKFWSFTLEAGDLLPLEEPGYLPALQRLFNLGYGEGDPTQWDDRMTQHAIKSFQRSNGIDDSGGVTAETRDAIKKAHGS